MPISPRSGTNALLINEGHLLVIETANGHRQLPGGTFDEQHDVSIAAGCSREIREETGVAIAPEKLQLIWAVTRKTIPLKIGHTALFSEYYYAGRTSATDVVLEAAGQAAIWLEPLAAKAHVTSDLDRTAIEVARSLDLF